jgi:quercetin dioxygenase-like cupin family protein
MTTQSLQSPTLLLAGEGESFQMLSHIFTAKVTGNQNEWALCEVTDTAGHGAPLHTHPWAETFYILEGEMEIQIAKRKVRVPTGASLHIPANVAHDFTICSPTIRALVIIPSYAEAFYRETSEKITTFPPNPEIFQQICMKHDVRLLER